MAHGRCGTAGDLEGEIMASYCALTVLLLC